PCTPHSVQVRAPPCPFRSVPDTIQSPQSVRLARPSSAASPDRADDSAPSARSHPQAGIPSRTHSNHFARARVPPRTWHPSRAFQTAQAPPPDRLPGAARSYPQFASPLPGAPILLCPWCRKRHSLSSGRDDSAYPAPPLPAPGSPCAARPFERTHLPASRILPPEVPHPAPPESRRYTRSCFPLTYRKWSRTVRCRSSARTQSPYRPAAFPKRARRRQHQRTVVCYRSLLFSWSRLSRIETQIGHGQRSAALPKVIVMLVHYPRSIPFPECAPTQSASRARHPDQLECPLRIRVVCNVSRDRGLANGYLHTTNFGHYVKRNQEVVEKCAHSRLSANHFLVGFAAYLDIIGVKGLEDRKMLFEAFADVGLDDGRV